MMISKAMNDHKDFPRCVIDYVRGAYKRALEKKQPTLEFALLKVAVQRAQAALSNIAPPQTIHVMPQQAAAQSSKNVEAVELRTTEGPAGRKTAKGKGKAKTRPEDTVDNNIDRRATEKHSRNEEVRAGEGKARKVMEKRGVGTGMKVSRG